MLTSSKCSSCGRNTDCGIETRMTGRWRLYSLAPNPFAEGFLYVHCINEVHRIQYHLNNAKY